MCEYIHLKFHSRLSYTLPTLSQTNDLAIMTTLECYESTFFQSSQNMPYMGTRAAKPSNEIGAIAITIRGLMNLYQHALPMRYGECR